MDLRIASGAFFLGGGAGCKIVEPFTGLMYKICRICSAHWPKHTVKSTRCPRKFNRRIQLTLNSSTVTPAGRFTTNEATPSLERVTLFFDSKSDVSWFASSVCALRITGTPPTKRSSESLTCTCLSEQSKFISTAHHFF